MIKNGVMLKVVAHFHWGNSKMQTNMKNTRHAEETVGVCPTLYAGKSPI
jgi:hypothetical protein